MDFLIVYYFSLISFISFFILIKIILLIPEILIVLLCIKKFYVLVVSNWFLNSFFFNLMIWNLIIVERYIWFIFSRSIIFNKNKLLLALWVFDCKRVLNCLLSFSWMIFLSLHAGIASSFSLPDKVNLWALSYYFGL